MNFKPTDKRYFEEPTQVIFFEPNDADITLNAQGVQRDYWYDETAWFTGIAYHDVIICADCGQAVDINSLYENVAEITMRTDIVFELPWVSISDAIADDDWYPCLSDEYEEERLK
jgi:hypothetical protein